MGFLWQNLWNVLTELEIFWRWTVCCREKSLGNKRIYSFSGKEFISGSNDGTRLLWKIRHIARSQAEGIIHRFLCKLSVYDFKNTACIIRNYQKKLINFMTFMTFCHFVTFCHLMTKFTKLWVLKYLRRERALKIWRRILTCDLTTTFAPLCRTR